MPDTGRAIGWLRYSKSINPDKPVFMYFAPGAMHAPHHVAPEWREQFTGAFDQGWDVVREETYQRQLELGVIPEETENTPLVALGGLSAGYALHVRDGKPVYHYNFFARERTSIASHVELPDGASTVAFEFHHDGGGIGNGGDGVLSIDGTEVGRARIDQTVPARFGIDTFGVGMDTGSPVTDDYDKPFVSEGVIERVDFTLGEAGLDPEEERTMQARFDAAREY